MRPKLTASVGPLKRYAGKKAYEAIVAWEDRLSSRTARRTLSSVLSSQCWSMPQARGDYGTFQTPVR